MTGVQLGAFQKLVWEYYAIYGRHDLPWRQPDLDGSFDPYKIVVSEIMLQQTQVPRVTAKFTTFTATFPSFKAVAGASLGEVLKAWSGLGYNRRAKYLWQTANVITNHYNGQLPETSAALVQLPGIGPNTAGAVRAYAFDKPSVFVETNIRTVFIHHFFSDQQGVHDHEILNLVSQAVPDNPRQWYWALMDYGAHIKQTTGNVSRSSAHYSKQSTFMGSKRQIRGKILKLLGEKNRTKTELRRILPDQRLDMVLHDLLQEGLIMQQGKEYLL